MYNLSKQQVVESRRKPKILYISEWGLVDINEFLNAAVQQTSSVTKQLKLLKCKQAVTFSWDIL